MPSATEKIISNTSFTIRRHDSRQNDIYDVRESSSLVILSSAASYVISDTKTADDSESGLTRPPLIDIMDIERTTESIKESQQKRQQPPQQQQQQNSKNSKIPYPPLASLLIGKTNQFRHSASTRLRESKTNLLFLVNNNDSSSSSSSGLHAAKAKDTAACSSGNETTTSCSRRNPITNNSTSTVRSFSLNSPRIVSTAKEIQLKKSESQEEICATNHELILEQEVSKKTNQNGDIRSVKLPIATKAQKKRGNLTKIMDKELLSPQQVTKKRDLNKMSLNLNGPNTTTSKPIVDGTTTTGRKLPTNPSAATVCARSPKTPNNHKQPLETVVENKLTPKTPPVTPDSPSTYLEDDIDSLYSFATTTTSGRSTMSCDHPYVARNGTTFSGRKMKYVVHCSHYAGQVGEDYLTPTQRAQRQIRRLRELLCSARNDLEQKDSELLRLTREVVELRLFKASLSSPEDRSNSSDAVTVREADLKTSQDVSPIVDMIDDIKSTSTPQFDHNYLDHHHHHDHHHDHHHNNVQLNSEMQSSFADSGHFEDMTTSSTHANDERDAGNGGSSSSTSNPIDIYKEQRQELIRMYEQRIEDLIKTQDSACSDMKRTHNDRVEALLQKLAECNTRYADIVPDYEHAKERIRELEKQLDDLQKKLFDHEEKQNKMYLHMYQKGQEAERISRVDQALELAHRTPNKVSINELLHQLQSTQDELENIRAEECRKECGSNHALLTAKEAISLWVLGARKTIYRRLLDAQKNKTHVDPEVTLQFLKSAVYYFLTDKENSQGHLQAIESILEFTEAEKQDINRARFNK